MKTVTRYTIAREVEGPLEDVIKAEAAPVPSLREVLDTMGALAFVVETVAHLQGKPELLATADKARALIKTLSGEG